MGRSLCEIFERRLLQLSNSVPVSFAWAEASCISSILRFSIRGIVWTYIGTRDDLDWGVLPTYRSSCDHHFYTINEWKNNTACDVRKRMSNISILSHEVVFIIFCRISISTWPFRTFFIWFSKTGFTPNLTTLLHSRNLETGIWSNRLLKEGFAKQIFGHVYVHLPED